MIIDCHHHWIPQWYLDNLESKYMSPGEKIEVVKGIKYHIREHDGFILQQPNDLWADIEKQLEQMDRLGIDMAVLSMPSAHEWFNLDDYKRYNEDAAELQQRYKNRFICLAHTAATDEGGVEELDRAIRQLGLKGAAVLTHIHGVPLDSEKLYPFYQKVVELDVPVFFHAGTIPIGGMKWHNAYSLGVSLARLHSMEIATARLLYSGIHELFPNLTFISPHFGGGYVFKIPWYQGIVYHRNPWVILGESSAPLPAKEYPPENYNKYLDKFYFECGSGLWGPNGFKAATQILSPERILLGTDSPIFLDDWTESTIRMVNSLDLPEDKKQLFFGENAKRLYHIH